MINLFIGLPVIGLLIFLAILVFVVWIWALIDCIKSDASGEHKLIWLLIIIFMNFFGAVLYFVFSKEFKKNRALSFSGKKGNYLSRSSDNKIIGGVCGGIAEHFSFDPAIIRILWIVFTIFVNGVGVLLYLIAWVAIPAREDVSFDKGSSKKVKAKSAAKKSSASSSNRKNFFLGLFLTIGVFVLLFLFVVGFVVISNLNYKFSESVTVKGLIVDVKSDVAEKMVVDSIINSYNFKNFEGHNLTLVKVSEPLGDSCTLFDRDPYGVKIYDSGCREFKHRFFVESDVLLGYDVTTLTSGGRILKMTFTSFTRDSFREIDEVFLGNFSKCLNEDRLADFCFEVYEPVCGFKNLPTRGEGIEFSNSCFACMNKDIKYFINGTC